MFLFILKRKSTSGKECQEKLAAIDRRMEKINKEFEEKSRLIQQEYESEIARIESEYNETIRRINARVEESNDLIQANHTNSKRVYWQKDGF
jgi:hypothetical protein